MIVIPHGDVEIPQIVDQRNERKVIRRQGLFGDRQGALQFGKARSSSSRSHGTTATGS